MKYYILVSDSEDNLDHEHISELSIVRDSKYYKEAVDIKNNMTNLKFKSDKQASLYKAKLCDIESMISKRFNLDTKFDDNSAVELVEFLLNKFDERL